MRETICQNIFGEPTYIFIRWNKGKQLLMRLLLVPSSFNVGRCMIYAIAAYGARERALSEIRSLYTCL